MESSSDADLQIPAIVQAVLDGEKDNFQTLEALLKTGSSESRDFETELGRNALHFAVIFKLPKAIRLIFQYNSTLAGCYDFDGYIPIHLLLASESSNNDILKQLVESDRNGEFINEECISEGNFAGYTPLHMACYNDKIDEVQTLLSHKFIKVNEKCDNGDTALHIACRYNYKNVLKRLLDHKSIDLNVKNNLEATALHVACEGGHTRIIKLLLEQSLMDTTIPDINGKIAEELLASTDLQIGPDDSSEDPPIIQAVMLEDLDKVRNLLDSSTVDLTCRDKKMNRTPLVWSIRLVNDEIFELLRKNSEYDSEDPESCNMNLADVNGWTALHHACDEEYIHAVNVLLKDTRVVADSVDVSGRSAFLVAATKGNMRIMNLFFKSATKRQDINLKIQDFAGNNCLHLICTQLSFREDEIKSILQRKVIKSLINVQNADGNTPLLSLHQCGHVSDDVVELLITLGAANINIRNNNGGSIFSIALKNEIPLHHLINLQEFANKFRSTAVDHAEYLIHRFRDIQKEEEILKRYKFKLISKDMARKLIDEKKNHRIRMRKFIREWSENSLKEINSDYLYQTKAHQVRSVGEKYFEKILSHCNIRKSAPLTAKEMVILKWGNIIKYSIENEDAKVIKLLFQCGLLYKLQRIPESTSDFFLRNVNKLSKSKCEKIQYYRKLIVNRLGNSGIHDSALNANEFDDFLSGYVFLCLLLKKFKLISVYFAIEESSLTIPHGLFTLWVIQILSKEQAFTLADQKEVNKLIQKIDNKITELADRVSDADEYDGEAVAYKYLVDTRWNFLENLTFLEVAAESHCEHFFGITVTEKAWSGKENVKPHISPTRNFFFNILTILIVISKLFLYTFLVTFLTFYLIFTLPLTLITCNFICCKNAKIHGEESEEKEELDESLNSSKSANIEERAFKLSISHIVRCLISTATCYKHAVYNSYILTLDDAYHEMKKWTLKSFSPFNRFLIDTLSMIVLIGNLSGFVMTNLHLHITNIEIVIYVLTAAYLLEEFREFIYTLHKYGLAKYLKNTYNIIDIFYFIFFISAVAMRITVYERKSICEETNNYCYQDEVKNKSLYIVRIFFVIATVLMYFKFLRVASYVKRLGPKLIMIRQMLTRDLLPFMFILFVFIFAYSVAFSSVTFPNGLSTKTLNSTASELIKFSVSQGFLFSFYGLVGDYSILSLTRGFDDEIHLFGEPYSTAKELIPYFFLILYVITVNILLLNLLIALFGRTVQKVGDRSQILWYKLRLEIYEEYKSRSVLPLPINVIELIFDFLMLIIIKLWEFRNQELRNHRLKQTEKEKRDICVLFGHILNKETDKQNYFHRTYIPSKKTDKKNWRIQLTKDMRKLTKNFNALVKK